jgi:hypothetical protein
MKAQQLYAKLFCLCLMAWLAAGSAWAVGRPDNGGGGVSTLPLPASTVCDYTTSTVSLVSTGGSSGTNVTTRYVLANETGTILQISPMATFTGLSGTATYQALALNYEGTIANLSVGNALSAVSASCFALSTPLNFQACVTPTGSGSTTPPPSASLTCDYNTSTISLVSTGGSSGSSVSTRYVLATPGGSIVQVSPTATFTGLSGTATYQALAFTYEGGVQNLAAGNAISSVTASCSAWSTPLNFQVCAATNPPTPLTCDYTIGDVITLRATGGSSGTGVKTSYVLANGSDNVLQVSATPSFNTTGLAVGVYRAYAMTYNDDNSIVNLAVGRNVSQIAASCLATSTVFLFRLCDCVPVCVPITVERLR